MRKKPKQPDAAASPRRTGPIWDAIRAAGGTQEDLAVLLGVSQQAVSKAALRGYMSVDMAIAAQEKLDIPASDLCPKLRPVAARVAA